MLATMAAVSTWQDEFQSALEADGVGKRTVSAYMQDLRVFERWFEEQNGVRFEAELMTGVDLRAFAEAQAKEVRPATWNRRRVALARFSKWLVDSGRLNYQPFQGVPRMEEMEPAPRWLDDSELHRFKRAMERSAATATTEAWKRQALRDQAMAGLMLYAGLREAEVCGLDWADIQITDRKGRVVVRMGKGRKRREIPLNKEVRRHVGLWRDACGSNQGAVFVGKGGQRIGTRTVQERIGAIRQAAGLDAAVTPHALRHTFAKQLLDSGVPLTTVSKLLGHSRLETTARYVQPGWEDFEKAVNLI